MSSQEPRPLEPRDYRIVLITQMIVFPTIWLGQVVTGGLDGGSGPRDIIFFTLLVWICIALGFWASLGTRRGRLAIIAVVSPLIGVLAASPMDLTEWVEFQFFCLGIILVVAIPCLGLRFTIGPLTEAGEAAEQGVAAGAEIQFGINHVLLWTLGTAILFQLARWLSIYTRLSNLGTLLMVLAYSASTSANIVFFIWAILGTRQVAWKLALATLVTTMTLTASYWIDRSWLFSLINATATASFALTLWLLRKQGLRLGRARPTGNGKETA